MKEVIILSSKDYSEANCNYGDCIIINAEKDLIIYDCGSEEHANRVIKYMDDNDFKKAIFVLSHNDSDHFNGLLKLIDENKISKIYTTLLLKYTDKILENIDDGRKTRESVKKNILETYSNITKLTGQVLFDIFEKPGTILSGVKIVGPDFDYMINTVAKRLDGREGNTQDGETAVNATSVQLSIEFESFKLLLCGDCSFPAIEDKISDYHIVQLPHHGKNKQAQKIFEKKSNQLTHMYIVSDNTGGSNGGSDSLVSTGYKVKSTLKDGDIVISNSSYTSNIAMTGKTLGLIE